MITVSTLSPDEKQSGRKLSYFDAGFQAVHTTITTGFLVPFALLLGANGWEIGLLGAIPPFTMILAAWLNRIPLSRKNLAVWGAASSRYLWLLIAALPLLDWSRSASVYSLLALHFVASLLMQVGRLAWWDWIGDLVDEDVRGRFLAWRNNLISLVSIIFTWFTGVWLDFNRYLDREDWGFTWIILLGVLAAVLSRWAIARQPDIVHKPPDDLSKGQSSEAVPHWTGFLVWMSVWTLVAGIAGPFYAAYALQSLGMSYTELAQYQMLGSIVALATQPFWGHWVDRGYRHHIFLFCSGVIVMLPALWLLATPGNFWPIWLDGFFNGLGWTGFVLCQTHFLLQLCPEENRRKGLGLYTALLGGASALSAIIGGWILSSGLSLIWTGEPLLFAIACGGRLICWIWLWRAIARWEQPRSASASRSESLPQT